MNCGFKDQYTNNALNEFFALIGKLYGFFIEQSVTIQNDSDDNIHFERRKGIMLCKDT